MESSGRINELLVRELLENDSFLDFYLKIIKEKNVKIKNVENIREELKLYFNSKIFNKEEITFLSEKFLFELYINLSSGILFPIKKYYASQDVDVDKNIREAENKI